MSAVVSDLLLKRNLFGPGIANRDIDLLSDDDCAKNLVFIVEYSSYLSFFAFIGMFVSADAFFWKILWKIPLT